MSLLATDELTGGTFGVPCCTANREQEVLHCGTWHVLVLTLAWWQSSECIHNNSILCHKIRNILMGPEGKYCICEFPLAFLEIRLMPPRSPFSGSCS